MSQHSARAPIVIGLVNNMPDGALKTTERQFKELLSAAAGTIAIRVRLFSLPEAPRAKESRAYLDENYENFDNLWTSRLDGLIVSGTEPRTPVLSDEPYWHTLTQLVDWAEDHTISTVWSCLAAHAAAYHLDGISRQIAAIERRGELGHCDCATLPGLRHKIGYVVHLGENRKAHADQCASGTLGSGDLILSPSR